MKNEPAKYQAGKEEIKGAQYTMMKKAFEVSQHWARNNKSFHEVGRQAARECSTHALASKLCGTQRS